MDICNVFLAKNIEDNVERDYYNLTYDIIVQEYLSPKFWKRFFMQKADKKYIILSTDYYRYADDEYDEPFFNVISIENKGGLKGAKQQLISIAQAEAVEQARKYNQNSLSYIETKNINIFDLENSIKSIVNID